MKKRHILSLCLILFASCPAFAEEAPPGGFGVSLGPSQIRFSGPPGETQEGTVRIWNKSQGPMRFMVEIADLGNENDAAGKLNRIFPTAGTLPHSCSAWIQLEQNELEVAARSHQDVKFLLAVPPDASGGRASVIFFRGMPSADKSGDALADPARPTTTVQIQPRIGVLVFYEAQGTVQRTGKLEEFKVTPPGEESPLVLQYTFENTGNTDILLSGNFYILAPDQALAAKGAINTVRTFPGDRGLTETLWEGELDPGQYHLVASFELGPDSQEVIVREANFEVPEKI